MEQLDADAHAPQDYPSPHFIFEVGGYTFKVIDDGELDTQMQVQELERMYLVYELMNLGHDAFRASEIARVIREDDHPDSRQYFQHSRRIAGQV